MDADTFVLEAHRYLLHVSPCVNFSAEAPSGYSSTKLTMPASPTCARQVTTFRMPAEEERLGAEASNSLRES